MMAALLTFAIAAAVLVISASALTTSSDAISERTGIGRVWIGAVLVAGATSLPEFATDIASVRIGAADLAAGDLFGSSMANMLILAVIDLMQSPSNSVLRRAAFDNTLAAALAIVLNALGAMLLLTRPTFTVLRVTPGSIMLVVIFVLGMRAIYRQGARQLSVAALPGTPAAAAVAPAVDAAPAAPASGASETMSLRRAMAQVAIAALAILLAAPFLANSAKQIAELSGLGNTFVGTLLVALVTSLPELVASIVAVRMGALDLAVGNLFGSCAFNMCVFFAMDLFTKASIFAALDTSHAVSALFGIVLMGLGLAAIVYRAERRFWVFEPDASLIVLVYFAAIWVLYAHVT